MYIPTKYPAEVLAEARLIAREPLAYVWSENEERVLRAFFTNLNGRFAFMHDLPANVGATVLSMYSRLQNPRGIRGVFVDKFLTGFLASAHPAVKSRPVEYNHKGKMIDRATLWLKEHRIESLDDFINHSSETSSLFYRFVHSAQTDPDYIEEFSNAEKAKIFLSEWLDQYGHNSIARMGSLWLIAEEISILLAKTFEWCRPGFGAVELSTRFVKMSKKGRYPISRLLAAYGVPESEIEMMLDLAFEFYQELAGDKTDGPFPNYLREYYGELYKDAPDDLKTGVFGETSDVLGNLLPCATLTSVGMNVSGEAFGMLLKHLYLDNTPESLAAAEAIIDDSRHIGANQFARHYVPTPWEIAHWQYLGLHYFAHQKHSDMRQTIPTVVGHQQMQRRNIIGVIQEMLALREHPGFEFGLGTSRTEHDKLPHEFEAFTVPFTGVMSFRGWRDLQRQGLSTHARTRVRTTLGFYKYNKPAPKILHARFNNLALVNEACEQNHLDKNVPDQLMEYVMSLGFMVGFTFFANLRQWEFCAWQRSGWSVNHEVRQVFLSGEHSLRTLLGKWWERWSSRVDMTPAYVFARGTKPIPLGRS